MLVPLLSFGVAFALDVATDRRYSQIWGSAALLSSVGIIPAIRRAAVPIGAYVAVWSGFNSLRAFAEDAGFRFIPRDGIAIVESRLFGGSLPSDMAQRTIVEPSSLGMLSVLVTGVYLSFFAVPHVVGFVLYFQDRARFWRFVLALGILFGIAILAFALVPTEPPWMVSASRMDMGSVVRLPREVLAEVGLGSRHAATTDQAYSFEPNPLATMPSIHLGVTVLIAALARRSRPLIRWGAVAYAVAMGFALVVSGEHYVLDVLFGALAAVLSWALAGRSLTRRPSGITRTRLLIRRSGSS